VCLDVNQAGTKVVTTAHRDLRVQTYTNEPWSRVNNQVSVTYFTGQNLPQKRRCKWVLSSQQSITVTAHGCLFL